MFEPVSESKQGISGLLAITNFKLTFVTAEENVDDIHQQNHLLGYTDICLSNVDNIYLIGDKKRKLTTGVSVPSKVKGIFIVCKNLRTWSFSFKFSDIGDGRNILNALLHHAFPTKHYLLFAYEYSLSEYIIVPASVTDDQLTKAAWHFQGSRPPIWSWSNDSGAALVKMAELSISIPDRTQENIMLENIRKNHPKKIQPVIIELNKDISIKSVSYSFTKLVELCSPDSIRQFIHQENNFYSLLENTKWLKHVSLCLRKSVEACEELNDGVPVILQGINHKCLLISVIGNFLIYISFKIAEGSGRDFCCIISSLVQLLLDPHFRTIVGFQSLIQKEWVAAGHPFCDRLGHLKNDGSEKAPLFLLYLDCVWQLCQQFPAYFEFTETYLTTLWDSTHVSIFETFIFNSERDRVKAASDPTNQLVLRSVWDWREQFSDHDIQLFYNPLYAPALADSKLHQIKPNHGISNLEIWSQCYFRWIPHLIINNGGKNQIEMYARLLQNDLAQLKIDANEATVTSSNIDQLSTCLLQMNINSFYPFSNKSSGNNVSTPIMNASFIMNESMIDSQSLLTTTD
ncbi:unnamed protein product [Trichogramma brassicae]|uniref:Myotubularin phosphatase domain-containing protein n=1 Tax=Trichogramma brassicae TaxID=86971 RepID=A0A6H5J761_9HYME|nr:unnamed protein product [Trichogramma brassicae]